MIVAFVYDFPHFKSAQGLFALARAGFTDVLAIAAPRRELGFKESPFQFRTQGMDDAHHPREVCQALGYDYKVMAHENLLVPGYINMHRAEAGLVLGARVLPEPVVRTGVPIVNLHPGVLPDNRGLDTLKWAVHDRLPQAVTAHVIDRRIDRGQLLFETIVDVKPADSPADIYNRVMWAQVGMIPAAMRRAHNPGPELGQGVYRKPMTLEQDVAVLKGFEAYKVRYQEICEAYRAHTRLQFEAEAFEEAGA